MVKCTGILGSAILVLHLLELWPDETVKNTEDRPCSVGLALLLSRLEQLLGHCPVAHLHLINK